MSEAPRFWNYRARFLSCNVLDNVRPRSTSSQLIGSRWKPPSKQLYDRKRSFQRNRKFQQLREERARLFGYVKLKNGEVISLDEALRRLRDGIRGEKEDKKIPNAISTRDILEWHQPESVRDVLDGIGEIDAVSEYPTLQIFPGIVLIDSKIRHRDPALNW